MKNIINLILITLLIGCTPAYADNFAATQGSGSTLATDDISSVHYPRYKMTLGADGTNDGDVSGSNPMPVTSGTSATSLGKAKDAAAGSTDTGVACYSIRDDAGSTKTSAAGDYQGLYTNPKGALYSDIRAGWQSSNADGLLKLEDVTQGDGEAGIATLHRRQDTATTLTSANGDYSSAVVNSVGAQIPDVNRLFQTADANSLLKAEDTVASSGDALVGIGGVTNESFVNRAAANDDYTNLATTAKGALFSVPVYDGNMPQNTQGLIAEDLAAASGDALTKIAGVINTAFSVPAANGDYTYPSMGKYGQFHVTQEYDDSMAQTLQTTQQEDLASASGELLTKVGLVRQDVLAASTSADGDYGFFKSDSKGALWVNSNTGTADLGKAEDQPANDGSTGIMALAVRSDAKSTDFTSANLDYAPQAVDGKGARWNAESKAEDSASADGDFGFPAFSVQQDASSPIVYSGATGDYSPIASNGYGALFSVYDQRLQASDKYGLLKVEDAVAATGDALLGIAGRINTSLASLAADADYTTPALSNTGAALGVPIYDSAFSDANAPIKREDVASADASALMAAGFVSEDPLTQNAGTTGDWSQAKVDRVGRLVTTGAPASETWSACSGTATGTSDTAIKAAVASNRIYTTDIDCNNFSTVPSRVSVKDGTTVIYQGLTATGVATASVWSHTFKTPLRGTSNTALNFAMGTTATSTICCASGYISVD